ncbi:MAG: metallophosphoesterase family protein [Bdellovibrionales bacterium]|nr:metallophosphoesterase family protein [Bdellovibrionales bacterium]
MGAREFFSGFSGVVKLDAGGRIRIFDGMKIAVLSDSHDRLDHLAAVLTDVAGCECERLFFLGDFCAPFSLAALAEGFAGPIDAVFGNNDGDVFLLCRIASKHPHVTLHQPLAELEVAGKKVALQHYPEIARRLAESGAYDAVFSGHDHQRYVHRLNEGDRVLWANPGEIMGRFGPPSWGLWDTERDVFTHRECGG